MAKVYKLTESSPAVDAVIPGTEVTLLEHQRRSVAAMIDAERSSSGQYNAAIIRDLMGSGKTYCIAALLCLAPPRKFSQLGEVNHAIYRKRYLRELPLNFIFVSNNVLRSWESVLHACKRRVFVVGDIYGLRAFYTAYRSGALEKDYDDVLVKNGIVTAELDMPELRGSHLEFSRHRSILDVISVLLRNTFVARVILDDFDTLKKTKDVREVKTWFGWFVSSTSDSTIMHCDNQTRRVNPYDSLRNDSALYSKVMEHMDGKLPSISSDPAFIAESIAMSRVHYYTYMHRNPHVHTIAAIGEMGRHDIAEMLHADALTTAAEAAGNANLGVADIFRKILGENHDAFMLAESRKRYCAETSEYCGTLAARAAGDTRPALGAVRENCERPGPLPKFRKLVRYRDDDVIGIIKEVGASAAADHKTYGQRISRLRERLGDGECPIMCIPLADCANIFVLGCCEMVVSDEAVNSRCVNVFGAGGEAIDGVCPLCRARLNGSMVLSINPGFIPNIIEGNTAVADVATTSPSAVAADVPARPAEMTKLNTFIAIASGTAETVQRTEIHPTFTGVMHGIKDMGAAAPEDIKMLFVANYSETFAPLVAQMDADGRAHAALKGTREQRTELVRRYWLPNSDPDSLQILMLVSPENCAGMNLQCTTDLILSHAMHEKNVQSQFIGRAARFGRKSNLNVHVLLYHGETL